MMAFIIFPASPEETHKRQHSISKSIIYNWKVFTPIYHLFSKEKHHVCVMLWEKAESTAEFTYFMFYLKWCVDGFKQLNSTQLLKKNIYQKTVISEAFALLRSTAKLPAAARSSFVFLMKFHWQYW